MKAQLGIVGLGRMGANLARLAVRRGFRVAGYTRGKRPRIGRGFTGARDLAALCEKLERPRRVILYVPAGAAVDALIDSLAKLLEAGDLIADGGNSYWGDSIRRHQRLRTLGIDFVDVGTSGGVPGASAGACFMVGGESRAVARIAPILKRLAVKGGYVHAGGPGTGHFHTPVCTVRPRHGTSAGRPTLTDSSVAIRPWGRRSGRGRVAPGPATSAPSRGTTTRRRRPRPHGAPAC